jgi:hypothetical protein
MGIYARTEEAYAKVSCVKTSENLFSTQKLE